jgi:hypothetical protein
VPVIAGDVERIVHALPRGALGFLKNNAHVTPLVGHQRFSAEMLGDRGKQVVGAPSRARDVNDDRGQRHQHPIVGPLHEVAALALAPLALAAPAAADPPAESAPRFLGTVPPH